MKRSEPSRTEEKTLKKEELALKFEDFLTKSNFSNIPELKKAVIEAAIYFKEGFLRLHVDNIIDEESLEKSLKEVDIIAFETLLALAMQFTQNKTLDQVLKSEEDSFSVYAQLYNILLKVADPINAKKLRLDYLNEINTTLTSELKSALSDDHVSHIDKEIRNNSIEINSLEDQVTLGALLSDMVKEIKSQTNQTENLLKLKAPLPSAFQDSNGNLEYMRNSVIIEDACQRTGELPKVPEFFKESETQRLRTEKETQKKTDLYNKIFDKVEPELTKALSQLQKELSRSNSRRCLFQYSQICTAAHLRMKIQDVNDALESLNTKFDNSPADYVKGLNELMLKYPKEKFTANITSELSDLLSKIPGDSLNEQLARIAEEVQKTYDKAGSSHTLIPTMGR